MTTVVTGSSGHLGEALVRVLRADGVDVVGLDVLPSPTTDLVGSVGDGALVRRGLVGAGAVLHTATLQVNGSCTAASTSPTSSTPTGSRSIAPRRSASAAMS